MDWTAVIQLSAVNSPQRNVQNASGIHSTSVWKDTELVLIQNKVSHLRTVMNKYLRFYLHSPLRLLAQRRASIFLSLILSFESVSHCFLHRSESSDVAFSHENADSYIVKSIVR
jgi:hypothetical protein